MKTLLKELTSSRIKPQNLISEDEWLFEHEYEKKIPECYMKQFSNVRALPSGVLIKDGKILPDSFASNRIPGKKALLKVFFERALNLKDAEFISKGTWVADNLGAEYFHWLTDTLPRIYIALKENPDCQILLPNHYSNRRYVRSSLEAFKLPAPIFLSEKSSTLINTLYMPTITAPMGNYNDEIIRNIGKLLFDQFGNVSGGKRRIYISRSKAGFRHIANESDVIAVLKNYNFEIVHLETMSFPEQVYMISEAKMLISNHGAGLTNMMFAPKGTKILEIRKQNDNKNNCYFSLASALLHEYFYLQSKPVREDEAAHTANLIVDVIRLKETVELMINEDRYGE